MADMSKTLKVRLLGDEKGLTSAFHRAGTEAKKSTEGISRDFKGMAGGLASVFDPTGMLGGFSAAFDQLSEHSKTAFGELRSGSGAMSSVTAASKTAALGFGVAGVAVAAYGTKLAVGMQEADSQVAAHANVSQAAAKKIGDAFLGTGGKFTFTAQQMMTALAPVAGQLEAVSGHALTSAESLSVMTAASNLAEASGQQLGDTTRALADVMQAYGMNASQAGEASDVLWNASRSTGVGITDLDSAIGRLHARLGSAAPSLTDTGALMTELSAQGLRGSRGITTVSTAMTTLLGGSKSVATQLQTLGVKIFDSQGKFIGLQGVIGQLGPKLAGLSEQQRDAALKTLFGASSAQIMGEVLAGGTPKFEAATKAVSAHGAAEDAAKASTSNFKGEMEHAKVAVSNLGTKLGEALLPAFTKLLDIGTKVVDFLMHHKDVAIALGAVIAAVLVPAVISYAVSMASAAAATIAATWPILAIIAAVALVGFGIYELSQHWSQVWGDIKKWAADAYNFLKQHLTLIAAVVLLPIAPLLYVATHWKQVWGDIKTVAAAVWHWLDSTAKSIFEHVRDVITGAINKVHDIIFGTWERIKKVFSSAFDAIRNTVTRGISDVVNFFKDLPHKIADAIGDLTKIGENIVHDIVHGIENIGGDIGSAIGGLVKHIPGAGLVGDVIGGLATGGLVTSPGVFAIAEDEPELVLPASKVPGGLATLQAIASGRKTPAAVPQLVPAGAAPGAGGATTINISGYNLADPHATANEIAWQLNNSPVAS